MFITREEILEKMKERDVVVLDVLPETNYEMLHIKGSYSLPIVAVQANHFVNLIEAKFGRDKFFITYCTGLPCRHFMEAADLLTKNGIKAAGYAGGLQEWVESGLPVEGTQV